MTGRLHVNGNTIGKYRLIAELGRGGMAEVFLALARGPAGFNKLLVIKRIRAHLSEDPEFLDMFLDEARLAARLSHHNVVQTNEIGLSDGQYFIAMEYLDGQPLNRIMRRLRKTGAAVSAQETALMVRILCEALAGLHHAHELCDYDGTPLRVVHRDATPHNIFVTYDGQVKVVDFGIAKAATSVAETRTGVLKGKVSYMAPEQARGEGADRRADIFSIGCLLWEVLAGERLWKGQTDVQTLEHILGHRLAVPSPATKNPGADARLTAICMACLAPRPEDRPPTALHLRGQLEAYLASLGDRTTVATVGALVASQFVRERAKLSAIIEKQMRFANADTGAFAEVSVARADEVVRVVGYDDNEPTPSGSLSGSPSLRAGAGVALLEHRLPGERTRSSTPSATTAGGTALSTAQVNDLRAPSRLPLVAALTALLVGGVALAVVLGGSRGESPAAASSATAGDEPAPAEPAPAEPEPAQATVATSAAPTASALASSAPAPPPVARAPRPGTAAAVPVPTAPPTMPPEPSPRPGTDPTSGLIKVGPKPARKIDETSPYE